MTDFAQLLFQNGYATPLMLARWRAKGGLTSLSPNVPLTQQGIATDEFRALWRIAFPDRTPLPKDELHDAQGHPSVSFHKVWR